MDDGAPDSRISDARVDATDAAVLARDSSPDASIDTAVREASVEACVSITVYVDRDMDTYGDDNARVAVCAVDAGYATRGGDCDDSVGTTHPGAAELCNNGDDDCDTLVDEGIREVRPATESTWAADSLEVVTRPATPGYFVFWRRATDGHLLVRPIDRNGGAVGTEFVVRGSMVDAFDAVSTRIGVVAVHAAAEARATLYNDAGDFVASVPMKMGPVRRLVAATASGISGPIPIRAVATYDRDANFVLSVGIENTPTPSFTAPNEARLGSERLAIGIGSGYRSVTGFTSDELSTTWEMWKHDLLYTPPASPGLTPYRLRSMDEFREATSIARGSDGSNMMVVVYQNLTFVGTFLDISEGTHQLTIPGRVSAPEAYFGSQLALGEHGNLALVLANNEGAAVLHEIAVPPSGAPSILRTLPIAPGTRAVSMAVAGGTGDAAIALSRGAPSSALYVFTCGE